jgi:regulatory protein
MRGTQLIQINEVKKTRYGYNVIFNEERVNIEDSVWSKFKLRRGQSLEKAFFKQLLKENELAKIRRKSLAFLARRRSVFEFKTYLRKLEANFKLIENLTKEYLEKGYLDDYNYALGLIEKEKSRYGKNKIKTLLIKKGIKAEIIEELLENFTNPNLENHVKAACQNVKTANYNQAYQKVKRSLIYKGYESREIDKLIIKHLTKDAFDSKKSIVKFYEQALKKHQKKFSGKELELRVKKALYNKGFTLKEINEIMRSQ